MKSAKPKGHASAGKPAPIQPVANAQVRVETEGDFFNRLRETVRSARAQPRGSCQVSTRTLSFQSASHLLAVLTPRRHALFERVRAAGSFESIEALAQSLARDRAAVSKDLKALSEAGLIQIEDKVFHGHGRRTHITPAASRIKLELLL